MTLHRSLNPSFLSFFRHLLPHGIPSLVWIAAIVACAVVIGGCRSKGAAPTQPAPAQSQGNWFCEMGEEKDEWDCVQDELLSTNPIPTRLPEPPEPEPLSIPKATVPPPPSLLESNPEFEALPPAPVDGQIDQPLDAPIDASIDAPEDEPEVDLIDNPTAYKPAPPPSAVPPNPNANEIPPPATDSASLPKHVRLAYTPPKATPIVELPPEFYAVQLIALSSRQRLEEYAEERQLHRMSAARIARNGELYYVLLLGIYESKTDAENATEDLPRPLDVYDPWIRPLGELQRAMIEGDALAASQQP